MLTSDLLFGHLQFSFLQCITQSINKSCVGRKSNWASLPWIQKPCLNWRVVTFHSLRAFFTYSLRTVCILKKKKKKERKFVCSNSNPTAFITGKLAFWLTSHVISFFYAYDPTRQVCRRLFSVLNWRSWLILSENLCRLFDLCERPTTFTGSPHPVYGMTSGQQVTSIHIADAKGESFPVYINAT